MHFYKTVSQEIISPKMLREIKTQINYSIMVDRSSTDHFLKSYLA